MAELSVKNIAVKAITGKNKGTILLQGASLTLSGGELVALLGPNGAGKTTLLRAAMGLIKPSSGAAFLNGENTASLSPMKRAVALSYLPQIRRLAWPNSVRDVVALGRFAHGGNLSRLGDEDARSVDAAMSACDLTELSARSVDTLSGGEQARVHIARALAANAPLLIADEPVAALDPRHQFRVMDLIKSYVQNNGGALVVLHDIGLAAKYADRLIWMKDGHIIADGTVAQTLNAERLAEVYGVRAEVSGTDVALFGTL